MLFYNMIALEKSYQVENKIHYDFSLRAKVRMEESVSILRVEPIGIGKAWDSRPEAAVC